MLSHTAKSPTPAPGGPVPLDNATSLVLAELQVLNQRLDALERLVRTEHAPTANHHLLMALEESMLGRLKMMSDSMTFMFSKTALYLQQMSEAAQPEEDPASMMEALAGMHAAIGEPGMAPGHQPTAPKGRGRRPSKPKR